MNNLSFLSLKAEEEPYILAVGAEGLWKQRLDSYGPGEFLHPDIRNISGKYYPNWVLLHTTVIRFFINSINGTERKEFSLQQCRLECAVKQLHWSQAVEYILFDLLGGSN